MCWKLHSVCRGSTTDQALGYNARTQGYVYGWGPVVKPDNGMSRGVVAIFHEDEALSHAHCNTTRTPDVHNTTSGPSQYQQDKATPLSKT